MKVKLIHITPEAEKHIAYCARVSSHNQENPEYEKLLRYMIEHKHWSPFEMASMCLEIETSRAISAQILRHRSFSFQEFSQRYAETWCVEFPKLRKQDEKNRQNSIEAYFPQQLDEDISKVITITNEVYLKLLREGVAKECARMVLPMCTQTRLYMHGTIRSWIHYIEVRTDPSTQLEHREIAEACKKIFIEQLPTISDALILSSNALRWI